MSRTILEVRFLSDFWHFELTTNIAASTWTQVYFDSTFHK